MQSSNIVPPPNPLSAAPVSHLGTHRQTEYNVDPRTDSHYKKLINKLFRRQYRLSKGFVKDDSSI